MSSVHPTVRGTSVALSLPGVSRLTDPVWYSGTGAPSGGILPTGQTLGASQPAVYMRRDGGASTALYVTVDGGTTWTAYNPAALSTLDLNGTELILDVDGNTSFTADTDDQIDIKIGGVDDFRFLANIFRALSGSVVETNTINETTAASGVTIDGLLIKDGSAQAAAIADPGTGAAIPVTKSGSIAISTLAAETNTLAIPTFQGQRLTLFVDTFAVGARVVTSAQRINQATSTIMTFGAVGDFIVLEGITIGGALRWQVVANDGVALS